MVLNLLSCHGFGEVGDDSSEESVVRRQADEQLELVVLAEPEAGRFDPRDQSCVHSAEDDKNNPLM
jgi:hypothetical protein